MSPENLKVMSNKNEDHLNSSKTSILFQNQMQNKYNSPKQLEIEVFDPVRIPFKN
jgi:hypothetical protein